MENSQYLQERKKLYDPRNRVNLKHYIITGYDGYVELVASEQYSINEKARREFIIDGNCFDDWAGFYDEAEKVFTLNLGWKIGRNLNAFNDILRGGFGRHENEPIHIKWINFDKSVRDLGEKNMDYIVSIILDSDNSGHDCTFEKG